MVPWPTINLEFNQEIQNHVSEVCEVQVFEIRTFEKGALRRTIDIGFTSPWQSLRWNQSHFKKTAVISVYSIQPKEFLRTELF